MTENPSNAGKLKIQTSFYQKENEMRDFTTGRFIAGNKSQTKHGHGGRKRTKIYTCWRNMINRCYQKSTDSYKNYGARGITVCDEWKKFENFKKDMGNPPSKKSTIERINVNGNYSKENCKWIDFEKQAINKTTSINLTANGQTKNLTEWARIRKINETCIRKRISRNWTHEEALEFVPKKKWVNCGAYKKTIAKP